MNSTVKDIADKLHTSRATLGLLGIPTADQLDADWGVYYNAIPDSPANCVALLGSTPPPPATALDKSEPVHEDPVQLRVRGVDPEVTFALAEKLLKHLYTLAPFDVTSGTETVNYLGILHGSGILPLGWDERRRYTHAVNLRVHRRRTAV